MNIRIAFLGSGATSPSDPKGSRKGCNPPSSFPTVHNPHVSSKSPSSPNGYIRHHVYHGSEINGRCYPAQLATPPRCGEKPILFGQYSRAKNPPPLPPGIFHSGPRKKSVLASCCVYSARVYRLSFKAPTSLSWVQLNLLKTALLAAWACMGFVHHRIASSHNPLAYHMHAEPKTRVPSIDLDPVP